MKSAVTPGASRTPYPATPRDTQVDVYHGTRVEDPYRWLERTDTDAVRDWVRAQNAHSQPRLEALPGREGVKQRLAQLWDYERWGAVLRGGDDFVVPVKRGGRYFWLHNSGRQDQSVLQVADALDATPRVLLDPNQFADDRTVALADFHVSPDGTHVAYATSDGGSDWKTWRIVRVDTDEDLPETLELTKFTEVAWAPDGRGFYYSRYPAKTTVDEDEERDGTGDDGRQVSVWYHVLGTPQASDRFVHAIADHPTRNPYAEEVTEDGRLLVLRIDDGFATNGLYYLDLSRPDAEAVRLLDAWDARYEYLGARGRTFYVHTTQAAPRGRIVAIDLDAPQPSRWRTLVPESRDAIERAELIGGHFVLSYLRDARSAVRVHRLDGSLRGEVQLPGLGQVAAFRGRPGESEAFFAYTDFLTPWTIHRYDVAADRVDAFRRPGVAFDASRYVTEQVFYRSKDGTRVPMFVTQRRDLVRDGSQPTLLYGYGGFDVAMKPTFSVPVAAWLEMGSVYAVANLRGGGEYGQEWHLAGIKTRRQNVFDDFHAAAEWLVENRYTSRTRLGIAGRSNGGLLVAAALLQRPDLYGAALPAVGVLDMLRYHTASANARQWSSDYGLAEDPQEFTALRAYSPVHNVRAGRCYPPTLITTAERDDRVVPWHSYKFAAALQAAQPVNCLNPAWLRVETRAGHGAGKPTWMQIEDYADQWAFLAAHLGMDANRP
ncbi:MAG: prolyl oligopeptidase family serine peptidase [Steroidobacteraceae bacterium]|nr:prolyl oligopeptidase family serine peptidase [Steroidobacteraceae bacterium]